MLDPSILNDCVFHGGNQSYWQFHDAKNYVLAGEKSLRTPSGLVITNFSEYLPQTTRVETKLTAYELIWISPASQEISVIIKVGPKEFSLSPSDNIRYCPAAPINDFVLISEVSSEVQLMMETVEQAVQSIGYKIR